MNKTTTGEKLWKIAAVALTILLALNVVVLFYQIGHSSSRGYAYEYSEFSRSVQKKDYPRMVDAVVNNDTRNLKAQKDTAQFTLLAQYYHAAMLHHAYAANGDSAAAAEQKSVMDALEPSLTDSEILAAAADIREFYK